jgi:Spy/CpxP family protein refolding chaperone
MGSSARSELGGSAAPLVVIAGSLVILLYRAAMAEGTPVRHFSLPTPSKRSHVTSEPHTAPLSTGFAHAFSVPTAGRGKWWNVQDVVQKLELSNDQRAQMDGLWAKFLEQRASKQRVQSEARRHFEDTLSSGDWKAAHEAADEWDKQTVEMLNAENELKIDVLSLLTEKQLEKFATSYSALLRHAWAGAWAVNLVGSAASEATPVGGVR